MKKYFLAIFAVIIALGLSAFNKVSKRHHTGKNFDLYYWYKVDYSSNPAGQIPMGSTNFFGTGVTESVTDATDDDDCTTTGARHCLRGFITEQTFSSNSTNLGDAQTPRGE